MRAMCRLLREGVTPREPLRCHLTNRRRGRRQGPCRMDRANCQRPRWAQGGGGQDVGDCCAPFGADWILQRDHIVGLNFVGRTTRGRGAAVEQAIANRLIDGGYIVACGSQPVAQRYTLSEAEIKVDALSDHTGFRCNDSPLRTQEEYFRAAVPVRKCG